MTTTALTPFTAQLFGVDIEGGELTETIHASKIVLGAGITVSSFNEATKTATLAAANPVPVQARDAIALQLNAAIYLGLNQQTGYIVNNAIQGTTAAVVSLTCTDGQAVTMQLTPIAYNCPIYSEGVGTEMRLQCQRSLNGTDWVNFGEATEYVGSDYGSLVMLSIYSVYVHGGAEATVYFRITVQTPQYGGGFRAPGGTIIVSRVTAA